MLFDVFLVDDILNNIICEFKYYVSKVTILFIFVCTGFYGVVQISGILELLECFSRYYCIYRKSNRCLSTIWTRSQPFERVLKNLNWFWTDLNLVWTDLNWLTTIWTGTQLFEQVFNRFVLILNHLNWMLTIWTGTQPF